MPKIRQPILKNAIKEYFEFNSEENRTLNKIPNKNKGIAWWVIQTSINSPPATDAETKKNWQYVNVKYKAANIKNTVKEYTKSWSTR